MRKGKPGVKPGGADRTVVGRAWGVRRDGVSEGGCRHAPRLTPHASRPTPHASLPTAVDTKRAPLSKPGPDRYVRVRRRVRIRRSVSVVVEGECIRFAQTVQHRFQRCEHWCGEADDRSERDRDRATRALGPVGHRESGDETPNHVTALTKKL